MDMRLQASAVQKELMEKTKIGSVEELMYADLRRAGWGQSDAFYAAFHHIYSSYPLGQQRKLMKQLEQNPYIKARIALVDKDKLSSSELATETSKEKVLSDLVLAKRRTKEGTKEWIDLTKMIADYTKIKQDDLKTDDQPIKYFIPVKYPRRCEECLIYKGKARKDGKDLDSDK